MTVTVDRRAALDTDPGAGVRVPGRAPQGGHRMFGYGPGKVIIPAEAAVIRWAIGELVDQGRSLSSVVEELNTRGVCTTAGGPWSLSTLKRLLTNPRLVTGMDQASSHGENGAVGIVPAERQAQVIQLFEQRNRSGGVVMPARPRRYLLTGGLALCALCGKRLQAQPNSNRRASYVCKSRAPSFGCGKIRVAAEPLDRMVAAEVLGRLASKNQRLRLVRELQSTRSGRTLQDELLEAEAQRRNLALKLAEGLVHPDDYDDAYRMLDAKIRDLHERILRSTELGPLEMMDTVQALAAWWQDATVDKQHSLLRTMLDHVTVGPARFKGSEFDPERVTFHWRHPGRTKATESDAVSG